jgi:hypothetical protein
MESSLARATSVLRGRLREQRLEFFRRRHFSARTPMKHKTGLQIRLHLWGACAAAIAIAALGSKPRMAWAQDQAKAAVRTEGFDRDPGWEGFNNHIAPAVSPKVTQDFGYSDTSFASQASGEMGGRICRASEPAWYGAKIASKTLDEKLAASGTFALKKSGASTGIFFGWFNGQQPSGMGRPMNSLGMMLSGAKKGGRLAIHLVTAQNQVCATFVTRYERYKTPEERAVKRPTPIKNDGTRYHWKLDYDPAANEGKGQIHFTIKSDSEKPEEFEGKVFTVDLPAGFKKQGTSFDHFGVINITRPGGPLTVYFGGLEIDGQTQDLSHDPRWEGSGNHATYEAKEVGGCHDFGFCATHLAGGTAGEIGGLIWRAPYAYYADRVGPLSLNDPLEASGRFVLVSGAPDSGFFFGWFNSQTREVEDAEPLKDRNFIGVSIGGPTRVGHYFLPEFATAEGARGRVKEGPVLKPGNAYEWTLKYDPAANEGRGQMRVTLGGESVILDLKAGAKSKDAVFDRFGIFCVGTGGGQVKAYLDDLKYTAVQP